MRAIIITGGEIKDYNFYKGFFLENDTVICADGGSRHLINLDLDADYFLGDFDSCDFDEIIKQKNFKNADVIRYRSEKNETDTEIAVNLAIKKGFDEIIILGGIGCRFDHTLANVLLLKKALKYNINACIINEKNEIRLTDKSISLDPVKNAYISIIALENTTNLTLKNLKYNLCNYTLNSDTSIGISNEFTDKKAEILFDKGQLLVIIATD